ncbi:MAG: CoA transferase [Polyangiaceae bacterium]|nr:CoA transferase [Polyangiaceae bacterium]
MTPLRGIRVLDLTRLLPGPFATLVLSDLGAQVDKIEDPGLGDYTRHAPPMVGAAGAAFHALNRGKRSAVLDLKSARGRAVFERILPRYDVLFEQFRPGVLARLGLAHERLLELHPTLVVCALTGYGQTGPLRDRAGHDLNYLARAGLVGLSGPADQKPAVPPFQLADVSGGLWSVIAILSALRERERTGKGSILDIAMLDSVIPFATIGLSKLLGGELPERGGELLSGGIAPYDTYLTADGQVMTLGSLEPKFLMKFCAVAGIEIDMSALLPGPHQAEVKARFARAIAAKTRADWEAFNAEHDVCLEPALRPDELLADPQVVARGLFFEGKSGASTVRYYRTPVTPADVAPTPAPNAGEHTHAIFREAGFDDEEIAALVAEGTLRSS